MPIATLCTVFNFTLINKPGVLLNFANRLRAADVSLLTLSAREHGKLDSTIRCIPERDPQFRDFAKSAELQVAEETVIHVIEDDRGGDFIRILERIATLNANIDSIEAITLNGKTGWIIATHKSHVDLLLMQINDTT